MSYWESAGKSDDWFTPAYIFDALGEYFDLDAAAAPGGANVPAVEMIVSGSLDRDWVGFVWMNPPFGGRNGLEPWLEKFFRHGSGIALVPDRTSAPWFQKWARKCDAILFVTPKIKFERPDGTVGGSPGTGTALLGVGARAECALVRADGVIGTVMRPRK